MVKSRANASKLSSELLTHTSSQYVNKVITKVSEDLRANSLINRLFSGLGEYAQEQ